MVEAIADAMLAEGFPVAGARTATPPPAEPERQPDWVVRPETVVATFPANTDHETATEVMRRHGYRLDDDEETTDA